MVQRTILPSWLPATIDIKDGRIWHGHQGFGGSLLIVFHFGRLNAVAGGQILVPGSENGDFWEPKEKAMGARMKFGSTETLDFPRIPSVGALFSLEGQEVWAPGLRMVLEWVYKNSD